MEYNTYITDISLFRLIIRVDNYYNLKNKITMTKVVYLLLLFLTVVGLLGGIGYSIYSNAYVISAGLIATAYVAWPGIKDLYEKLSN